MKYVAIYSIVYAVALLVGWYSPGVPAAVVVGLSHLCGLMGALAWKLNELSAAMNRRTAVLLREMRQR